jgi:hypothetical protein
MRCVTVQGELAYLDTSERDCNRTTEVDESTRMLWTIRDQLEGCLPWKKVDGDGHAPIADEGESHRGQFPRSGGVRWLGYSAETFFGEGGSLQGGKTYNQSFISLYGCGASPSSRLYPLLLSVRRSMQPDRSWQPLLKVERGGTDSKLCHRPR